MLKKRIQLESIAWLSFILIVAKSAYGAEVVGLPWQEFKILYRKHIEGELSEKLQKGREKQHYSIEHALFELKIKEGMAHCHVKMKGELLSKGLTEIPLLPGSTVLSKVKEVSGGKLVVGKDEKQSLSILCPSQGSFTVELSFLPKIEEDRRSSFLELPPSPAIENSLALDLAKSYRLLEQPARSDGSGLFRFPRNRATVIRFALKEQVKQSKRKVDIESCSHIFLNGRRLFLTAYFKARAPLPPKILLRAPRGSSYISSSLPKRAIIEGEQAIKIKLPEDDPSIFWLRFALDGMGCNLPSIVDNRAREGIFLLEDPDDGQISFKDEQNLGALEELSPSSLLESLAALLPERERLLRLTKKKSFQVSLQRFSTVQTPALVLDEIQMYCSFEENGSSLSILEFTLPELQEKRLNMKPVKAAEIWSLTVNGESRRVFEDDKGQWVLPLAEQGKSRVRLCFLRQGEKLGLRGRLQVIHPALGIPAKDSFLTIGLPKRVNLVSLEGPVVGDARGARSLPKDFVGKAHSFRRHFAKGEEISVAVYYREPVDQ